MQRTRPRGASNGGEGPRQRPRGTGGEPELELSEEEVRALADEGLDPEDLERVQWDRPENAEASEHDRDSARDDLEALVIEAEEGQ